MLVHDEDARVCCGCGWYRNVTVLRCCTMAERTVVDVIYASAIGELVMAKNVKMRTMLSRLVTIGCEGDQTAVD